MKPSQNDTLQLFSPRARSFDLLGIRDQLLTRLSEDYRGYARMSFHEADAAEVHVMAMILKPHCSIISHRSSRPGNNFYMALEGSIDITQASGATSDHVTHTLTEGKNVIVVDRRQWRIVSNNKNKHCMYLETTSGPFVHGGTSWNWVL